MSAAHEYITSGALMKCDKGTVPASLAVLPTRTALFGGQPPATSLDKEPLLNNFNFGVCSLTQKPCLATCRPVLWRDTKDDFEICGGKALLDNSYIMCAMSGKITFITTGQLA